METLHFVTQQIPLFLVDTGDNPHRGWKLVACWLECLLKHLIDTMDNPHRGWKLFEVASCAA